MKANDYYGRHLERFKWLIFGLTALSVTVLEAYYYFIRGVPLAEDIIDWLIGMVIAVVLIEITFRYVANVQGRLQQEISNRKFVEETLKEKEQRFRSVMETANDAIITIDSRGGITFWNKAAETVFGYPVHEALGRSIAFLMPERFRKDYQNGLDRFLSKGKSNVIGKTVELAGLRKDGSEFPLELSLASWKTQDKVFFTGIVRDITDRRQTEEQIRQLSSAVQQSIDGIAIGDLEPKLTYVNEAFARMHDYDAQEMIGMKAVNLHNDRQMEELKRAINHIKMKGSWVGEIEHIRKDGTPFPTYMSTTLLKDTQGKPTGILAVARDITDHKALEAQLLWSQKMETVGRLAGGVAHDFNNILTTIEGNAELCLMELRTTDPLYAGLEEIQKASDRAAKLIQQLLAFSNRQITEPKVVNLNDVLLDMDTMLRHLIGEDIELVTLLEDELGHVKADPSQIEQVLVNLAVNARDAMPKGGKLTLKTANVTLDRKFVSQHIGVTLGDYVVLRVSDTGVGMTDEVKQHLFEPFFTTKETGKGTGLGLATCYGIVKQSGGNIWVYSEPGKGTTFKIYLPAVEEQAETLSKDEESRALPQGSETVLVVEDEPAVRDIAARALRQQGYSVLEAANGEEALRVSSEHRGSHIDLLLTDVVMPQMGGKPLADRLKSERPDTKILFCSGYPGEATALHGVLDQGIAFLQKPFCPAGLARKVRELLDHKTTA